jgi:hypothetical protein
MAAAKLLVESVMAEKLSKSILRNLRKMLHRAPKKLSASTSKKPSAPKGSARNHNALAQGGTPEAPEAKPDKKKTPNQPWYRHRQRW